MRSRVSSTILSMLVLVIASFACSLPGSNPPAGGSVPVPSNGGGSAACNNPLYPVAVGVSWTYSFNGAAPGNFTRTITAVNSDGFSDQDVFDSGISRSGEWKCEAGSLIALKPDSDSPNASAQSENVSATFTTTSMDGVTLPGNVNSGDTWSQHFTMEGVENIKGTDVTSKSDVALSCTAGATESVTVPAGTFNAVHMDCATSIAITITMNGTDIPSNVSTTSAMWYAPGVGMVKSDNVLSNGETTTLELTAYNIP